MGNSESEVESKIDELSKIIEVNKRILYLYSRVYQKGLTMNIDFTSCNSKPNRIVDLPTETFSTCPTEFDETKFLFEKGILIVATAAGGIGATILINTVIGTVDYIME